MMALPLFAGIMPINAFAANTSVAGGPVTEAPTFSYGANGQDFNGSRPYYYLKNNMVHVNFDPNEAANNALGSFSKGTPTDFVALSSNRENVDWSQFRMKPAMDASWDDKASNLDLALSVNGNTIIGEGFAKNVPGMNATIVYSLPDDSIPALKMEVTLKNEGASDYMGFFEYLFDPDEASEQVSYTPGVGYSTSNNQVLTSGWTENYLFNGPNGRSSPYTSHTIVWPNEQQPTGLVNEGYISGVWFSANIPAGESKTYIIYHVMTVPQSNQPYAEAAYYANIISHGYNISDMAMLSGRVTDSETGEGLPNVKIIARYAVGDKSGQTGGTALTGANGTYSMLVEKDVYTLTSTALRYRQGSRSIDLQAVEPVLDFELQPLEGARVLRDVPLNAFGSGVEATPNDFVLENDLFAFSLVDTGNDDQIPIPFTRGRVLDMSSFEASFDGIDWIYTSWLTNRPVTGEQWNRYTTRFDTIEVTQNTPDAATVTATGVYDENIQANPNARTCDVVQIATIKPGDYFFTLDTTIINVSGGTYSLYAGDLIDYDFGGAQRAYSPGVGEYTADRFYNGAMTEPWIAGYGSGAGAAKQTYGIVYDELWPGEQMTAFGYNRWIGAYRYITLEDGESFTYSRKVAIVPNSDFENPWDAIGALFSGTGNALDVSIEFDNKLYQPGDIVTVAVNIANSSDMDLEDLNIDVAVPYQLAGVGESRQSFPVLAAGESISAEFTYRAIEGGRGKINYLITSGQIRMKYSSAISISGAGWYGGDNHSHTTYSDGSGSVKDNTDAAYAQGLSWLYSTDHNSVGPRFDSQTITNNSRGDFFSITGNEITSSIGHGLGYQLPVDTGGVYNTSLNRMPSAGRTWQTVIDEVNRDGGFFYVAHPNYPGLEFPDVYNIRNYAGLEVWNGFYHAIDPAQNVSTQAFIYWDEINSRGEAKYFGIANSDGHNPGKQADPYSIGYMDSLSISNIDDILRNGKFFGTNGPQLRFDIDGVSNGETLKIEGSSRTANVTIAAFDELYPLTTVTLYKLRVTGAAINTREIVKSWDLRGQNLNAWTETLELTVANGEFYRVEIASTTGTTGNGGTGAGSGTGFAFSNPIWIESTANQTNDIVIDSISINASHSELVKTISGSYYIISSIADSLTASNLSIELSGNSVFTKKEYDAVNKVFTISIAAQDGTVKNMSIYVLDGEEPVATSFTVTFVGGEGYEYFIFPNNSGSSFSEGQTEVDRGSNLQFNIRYLPRYTENNYTNVNVYANGEKLTYSGFWYVVRNIQEDIFITVDPIEKASNKVIFRTAGTMTLPKDNNGFFFQLMHTLVEETMPVTTLDGHVFKGWYLDAEFTQPVVYPYDVARNTTIWARFEAIEVPVVTLVRAVATAKDFISIVETAKNSNVWVLSFRVTEIYSDGSDKVVPYAIEIKANNANVDGKFNLGAYTLIYDIKGNGSNIKEFKVVIN